MPGVSGREWRMFGAGDGCVNWNAASVPAQAAAQEYWGLFKLISNSDRLEQHKQKLRGKSMRIFRACESFHRYI